MNNDPLCNEVSIELAGEVRTMRASFTAIINIEKVLGKSMTALIGKIADGDLAVTEAAHIIYHGLRGYDDKRLSFEEVGAARDGARPWQHQHACGRVRQRLIERRQRGKASGGDGSPVIELPWESIMSSALGILKWSPAAFWNATFYDYTAAMKGHLASLGVDMNPPMTRDEFLDMKAEDLARTKTNEKPDA